MEKYFLTMLVDNEDGVLNRISGLFSRRGYRINNLSFKETEDPEFSRMTIEFSSNSKVMSQIMNQVNKLVSVRKIEELRQA